MAIDKALRTALSKKVQMAALGNSDRSLKIWAVDLINASAETGKEPNYRHIADRCYLHPTTVKNLATQKTRNPQTETVERVLRHFGVRLKGDLVTIHARYEPKPKE